MLPTRYATLVFALLAICCWASSARADWGVALDLPLTYAFNSPDVNKQGGANNTPAQWKNPETGNVNGFILSVYTPVKLFDLVDIGFGFDQYEVTAGLAIPNPGPNAPSSLPINMDVQVYDLLLDIPTELFNFGIGYGQGAGSVKINFPAGSTPSPISVQNSTITQYLLSFGANFRGWDIHLSYRFVTASNALITGGGSNPGSPPNYFLGSGTLTTLGARLNF